MISSQYVQEQMPSIPCAIESSLDEGADEVDNAEVLPLAPGELGHHMLSPASSIVSDNQELNQLPSKVAIRTIEVAPDASPDRISPSNQGLRDQPDEVIEFKSRSNPKNKTQGSSLPTKVGNPLSSRLSLVQQSLTDSHRRTLTALGLQVEAARILENDVTTLRQERQALENEVTTLKKRLRDQAAFGSVPATQDESERETRTGSKLRGGSVTSSTSRGTWGLAKSSGSSASLGVGQPKVPMWRKASALGAQLFGGKQTQRMTPSPLLAVNETPEPERKSKIHFQLDQIDEADATHGADIGSHISDEVSPLPFSSEFDAVIPQSLLMSRCDPPALIQDHEEDATKVRESHHSTHDIDGMISSPSSFVDSDANNFTDVHWQVLLKHGFSDYDERSNRKIERLYRDGESKCRLRSGRSGFEPPEIFFSEMLQYDPISGSTSEVRRLGPLSFSLRIRRLSLIYWKRWKEGAPRTLADYQGFSEETLLTEGLDRIDFDVRNLYKSNGICAIIARNMWFSVMQWMMSLINVMWISVDVDFNNAVTTSASDVHFQIMENLFCIFFPVELLLRFGAFAKKKDCFKDVWFRMDLALVLIMMPEIWLRIFQNDALIRSSLAESTPLRIARLLRLLRVAHPVRATPGMVALLHSIVTALKSVVLTVVLLIVLLYIFGCVFKSLSEDANDLEATYFASVGDSMLSLFCQGTLLDGTGILATRIKGESGIPLLLAFLLFIFLSSFILLSLLIGILCQVVAQVSKAENEEKQVAYLKQNLLGLLECYDVDGNQSIDRDGFDLLLENPETHECLHKFGADINGLMSLGDVLFMIEPAELHKGNSRGSRGHGLPESKQLSFKQFLEVILRLRGEKGASVTDIVELREYIRQRQDHLEAMVVSGSVQPRTASARLSSNAHSRISNHHMEAAESKKRTSALTVRSGSFQKFVPSSHRMSSVLHELHEQQDELT